MAGFFVPRSELAADLAEYFASFQQVISYLYDPDGFFEANLRRAGVKNLLSAYVPINDTEHAARQLAQPLQSLALFLDDHAATVHPSPEDHAFADSFFGSDDAALIAVHPGSGSPRKNWPPENWIALGRALLDRSPPPRLLLVGGEADYTQLDTLLAAWRSPSVLVARDLPLPHLAALLARCRLFIGHDSGISHLAAAARVPCLLLFGPTDPAIWAPANPQVTVLATPTGDLAALSVDLVTTEAARILAATHAIAG
jgi:heptosyltransferase-2